MHRLIVQVDDATFERLRKFAPGSKQRSDFIREAIRRALNERVERDMERAYRKSPQGQTQPELYEETWAARRRERS